MRDCFARVGSGSTAVLLVPFLLGGDELQRLATGPDTITYTNKSSQSLRALGDPPDGVEVVILLPPATKAFLGSRVVEHLLQAHQLTAVDVLTGVYSPEFGEFLSSVVGFLRLPVTDEFCFS